MKHNDIRLSVGLGASALALTLGVGVGILFARVPSGKPKAALAPAQAAATVSDNIKRYKIPVSSAQPVLGPADALATIVEWCDAPDPECAAIEPALQALLKRETGLVRLVYRHYGRPNQPGSSLAHQFLAAAFAQGGKFWEAQHLLLAHKGELTRADLEKYCAQLGLDWHNVAKSIDDHSYAGTITADRLFATMFDVTESPAIFVNGRPLVGKPTQLALDQLVEEELTNGVKLIAKGVQKSEVYAELTKKGVWTPVNPSALR